MCIHLLLFWSAPGVYSYQIAHFTIKSEVSGSIPDAGGMSVGKCQKSRAIFILSYIKHVLPYSIWVCMCLNAMIKFHLFAVTILYNIYIHMYNLIYLIFSVSSGHTNFELCVYADGIIVFILFWRISISFSKIHPHLVWSHLDRKKKNGTSRKLKSKYSPPLRKILIL